jgi:hypothetical protein
MRCTHILNNYMFVILTAMTEIQGSESIKSAYVAHDNYEAKPIAGIAMVGLIVIAALLLSGLSLIGSYQRPVIAQQQNMTVGEGGNATTTGVAGGNQSEVRIHIEEARTALQNNDTQGALMHLDLALNILGGAGGTEGNMTTGATIAGTDATNTDSEDAIPSVGGANAADEDSECGGVTVGGTTAADDYGCPPDPDA